MDARLRYISFLNAARRQLFHRSPPRIAGYVAVSRFSSFAKSKPSEDEITSAREWFQNLNGIVIPRNICDVSFSRSSGPGGQNVNKVNSKATLKIPLTSLLNLIPPLLHSEVRASRYVAERTDSLVIQSDESRKQSENVEACFTKLQRLLEDTAKAVIPGETSESQRERVKTLQKTQRESRLRSKKLHSSKKSSRRKSKSDE